MSIQLPDNAKNRRAVKKLKKSAQDVAINESLPEIPDAAKVISDLQQEVAKLKKRVNGLAKTQEKLWKDKITRDMRS